MSALTIGLTGGIGSGKSLALKRFKRLGAVTVSSDEIAREVVLPGKPAHRKIVNAFGRDVLNHDRTINRAKLGAEVFASASHRRMLEKITHPAIRREMDKRLAKVGARHVAVADVPLLFEAGISKQFDLTMLVSADKSKQLSRVMHRDGLNKKQAAARMRAQWSMARKKALADIVVDNNGSRKDFLKRINEYHKAFSLIANSRGK